MKENEPMSGENSMNDHEYVWTNLLEKAQGFRVTLPNTQKLTFPG